MRGAVEVSCGSRLSLLLFPLSSSEVGHCLVVGVNVVTALSFGSAEDVNNSIV